MLEFAYKIIFSKIIVPLDQPLLGHPPLDQPLLGQPPLDQPLLGAITLTTFTGACE